MLGRLDPAEILAPATVPLGEWERRRGPAPAPLPAATARRRLAEAFAVASLDAFGSFGEAEAVAAAAALDYVRATQAGKLPHLARPAPQGEAGRMEMDAATRASLEIARARDGGTTHTLLAAVDRTLTAAGARLLAEWLAAPLTDPAAIAARQDGWGWLLADPAAAQGVRAALRGSGDMARALSRLSLGRGGPRDLVRDPSRPRCGRCLRHNAGGRAAGVPWGRGRGARSGAFAARRAGFGAGRAGAAAAGGGRDRGGVRRRTRRRTAPAR